MVEDRLERLALDDVRPIWDGALRGSFADASRWIHGDLHARNVIVEEGGLRGILDWGDMCRGDVATDLACAWMLLDSRTDRQEFFATYGASSSEVARAAGWAVNFATAMMDSGVASHVAMGHRTIQNLLSDRSD